MNEKYLKDLYGWIGQKDNTFSTDIPFEKFVQKMQDESYAKQMHDWIISKDPTFRRDVPFDSFVEKVKTSGVPASWAGVPESAKFGGASPTDIEELKKLKKKEQSATTELPVAASSSALQSQQKPKPKEDEGFLSKAKKALERSAEINYAFTAGIGEELLSFYDNAINATKAMIGGAEEGELTPKQKEEKAFKEKFGISETKGTSPLDPRAIFSNAGNIASKIINSTIPQEQKNKLIQRLTMASNTAKIDIEKLKTFQEEKLPDNIPTKVVQGIVKMAPDLVLAAAMENPAVVESKLAKITEQATKKAAPIVQKYAPKAAKVLEESIKSPFTKIMAVKEGVKEMAETKEGENPYWNAIEGSAKGALEGMEMYGLGMAAGKAAMPIAKGVSKLGVNSAVATAIAMPLANAGVFTTARALRTAATEGRMITGEEAAMEAGTGIGFSLLHLKTQFDNQNEANHYYDNILNDKEVDSFGRVLNETKMNLDLAYNPDLTPEQVKELQEARDEVKKAILKEPDMQKKKLLGDEAIKIQNQLDAHNNVQYIVENKDFLIDQLNNNESLSADEKKFYTRKIAAIAETYDMSEYAVKTREFNTKITEAQKALDDAGERFTNAKNPVARAEAKNEVDLRRKELEDLNNQLTELITKKQEQDTIQKQKSDESLLRAGEERLGLRKVGEGDTESQITPEQEKLINDEKSHYQEILDNPNSDEQDLQEANAYFENPIAHLENQVKFWENEVKDNPEDQDALDAAKAKLEAHKAMEAKQKEVVTDDEYNSFIDKGVVSQERLSDIAQKVINRDKLSDRENEIFTDKTSEINKIISEAKPEVLLSGLSGGFKGISYESFDIRAVPEVMSEISNENSFAKTINYKGKKYVVVGLRLETARPQNTVGRDNYSFAVAELNNTTPKNIVEILENEAKENFKNIYNDFNKNDVIKEITTKDDELKSLEEAKPTEADIERRKEEAKKSVVFMGGATPLAKDIMGNTGVYKVFADDGNGRNKFKELWDIEGFTIQEVIDKINEKYDAELKALKESKPAEAKPEGITIGAESTTATNATPTATTGGEGTETKTGGTDVVKTKKNEDNEHVVTLNGEEVGKIYYDPSQKTWNNADFSRAGEKPYTSKWIYGDVLGDSKQQAIDEIVKRHNESMLKKEEAKKEEEPQKVQYTKDNILNKFLNKLNELNPLQRNPIDNKSFVYNSNSSLKFNRFNKGDKNEIALESILAIDKGKGVGKSVIKDITNVADELGITLTLDAKPFGRDGLTKQQLVDFYKKNGFKVDFEDAYGGAFKTEQELIDYALENESEAIPMSREPQPIEIKAGETFKTSEGESTATTGGEGTETKTGGTQMSEREIELDEEIKLDKLNDELRSAQKEIGRSDNPEEAIKKYNEKKKEKEDFENSIEKRKQLIRRKKNIEFLIQDEIDSHESDSRYEFKDLYEKDPRLAALARAKDMLDFAESGELEKSMIERHGDSPEKAKEQVKKSIERDKRDIEDLENDLKENPTVEKKAETLKKEGTIELKAGGNITATTTTGKPTSVTMAKVPETKTEGIDVKSLPDYEKTMSDVEFEVPKSKEYVEKDLKKAKERYRLNKTEANKAKLDKAKAEMEEYKADVEKAKDRAKNGLTESTTYKAADDIQKDALMRELAKKFGEKQPTAPKPEELFGNVSETAKIMEELNFLFDDANKSKDYLNEKYRKAKEAFDANPTSQKLKENMLKAKAEVEEYKTKNIDEAIVKLKESESYKKATPDQQARMEKYLTDKFLKSQTSKILPTKLFEGAKDIKKVTITEKKRWADQLKAFVRGAKNAADATKVMMTEIKSAISELSKGGSITAKQAETIINKMASLKVSNEKGITKFIDYVSKVFADAEYGSKITNANSLRSQISKLSGVEGKDPSLVMLAKDFMKIKPSMVEDIDAYNDMAEKIKESLRGTKIRGKETPLKVAEMVKISEADKYIKEQLKAQEQKIYEEKLAEMNDLFDTDFTGATLEQLLELAKSDKPIDKEKETIIRDAIKKMFDMNSTVIKHIIETGKDPFTGEDIDLRKEDIDVIKKFMAMDISRLSTKEAVEAIDKLSNFLQNGSTARMQAIVEDYIGKLNAEEIAAKGLKATELKFYGSKEFGRNFTQQLATLPMMIETMFRGVKAAAQFEDKSGITDLANAKTLAQSMSIRMSNEYVDKFYKTKANGKDFTDQSNIVERGMIADLKRTIPGTPEQQQAEFERNKGLIEQSIKELGNGTEKEKSVGKIYQEVYDKILKDSKNIEDVLSKSDNVNKEAIDWWTEKWAEIYDQLADVSENVYNKLLDRDIFFTPKKLSKLFGKEDPLTVEEQEEMDKGSMFHNNSGQVYKTETGVLKKASKDYTELPKNKNKQSKRYVDLSFDKNNVNSMYDALMDIHTAGVVRRIESFFNSPEIEKIIPSAEDRNLLYNSNGNGSVQDFIRKTRGKEIIESTEVSSLLRKLNTMSSIGVSSALGSLQNIAKQTISVGVNTLINTEGGLDLGYRSSAKADFMDRIGYGISVRGLESQGQISSINKLIDLASKSKTDKALQYIDKAGRQWLKWCLANPDVFIAKASWISYYEKALKEQGTDPSTIDYKTHEVNREAANYAQRMVDRQQNISDADLQGKLLGTKDVGKRSLVKMLMPFASFRMNQFMRAKSDLAVIRDKSSTEEDKKIASSSLVGYGAEMLTYKLLVLGLTYGMGSLAYSLMGKKESDEERKKRKDNLFRGQTTGTITDVFSPIPTKIVDEAYAYGVDAAMNGLQSIFDVKDEDRFRLIISSKQDALKFLGVYGVGAQKAKNLLEVEELARTGEFTDEYGRKKYISQSDRESLKPFAFLSLLSTVNILPADANTLTRNAIKFAKEDASSKKGGKSDEDILVDEMTSEQRELNKEELKQERDMKAGALEELKQNVYDENKISIINKKIDEYLMTDEERKQYREDKRNERFYEKQRLEELLGEYDSKSDMKRYNPALYEERFGEKSEWYKEHKDEIEVEKMMNELIKKKKDEAQGYSGGEGGGFGEGSFGKGGFGEGGFGNKKNK